MKFARGEFFSITISNFVALIVLLLLTTLSCSAEIENPTANLIDGTAMLQKMLDECNSWNDYSCATELYNYKPHSTTITHSKLFYKKGPHIRIEMVGGFKNGTVLLRGPDGKCTGRLGFWLGGILMKFEPDAKALNLPSGYNALRADFPETFSEMKELVGRGYTCKVSSEPVEEPKRKSKALVLELLNPEKKLSERVYLQPEGEHYPIRWDSLKDGELKSSTWFKNMKVDSGLPDSLFKL